MAEEKPFRVEDKRAKNFTIVENEVIDSSELTPAEKMVYITLCRFAYHDKCHPSTATIAELAGISRRAVFRAINKLCELGLIEKRRRKTKESGNTSNVYTIVGMPQKDTPPYDTVTQAYDNMTQAYDSESQPLCHSDITLMTQSHNPYDTVAHEEYLIEENIIEEYLIEENNTNVSPNGKKAKQPKPEVGIVTHLYEKLKELGIRKSKEWFKKQIGIARQLLSRYPPEEIIKTIDFALQDSFWKGAFCGLEVFERAHQRRVTTKPEREEGRDDDADAELQELLRRRLQKFIEEN